MRLESKDEREVRPLFTGRQFVVVEIVCVSGLRGRVGGGDGTGIRRKGRWQRESISVAKLEQIGHSFLLLSPDACACFSCRR